MGLGKRSFGVKTASNDVGAHSSGELGSEMERLSHATLVTRGTDEVSMS